MVIPQTGNAVKVKKKRVIIKAFIYINRKVIDYGVDDGQYHCSRQITGTAAKE